MRRSTRRALINITLFISALSFIIYLNRPSSKKLYAWNRIRYVSQSTEFPGPHGKCSGLSATSKPALVVSRVTADGDQTWIDKLKNRYHSCVYTVDVPYQKRRQNLQVPANRGHEAMAYLTFIIDNYDSLPNAVVFIHGSRFAWHNDHPAYDNAVLLSQLNVSRALEPYGYHNLKCDWSASTCYEKDSPPQRSLETSMRAATEPWNERVVSDSLLPAAFATLFGGPGAKGEDLLLGRRDALRSQCCAQFVVSKDRILDHSRDEYVALRQWLLDGIGSSSKKDAKGGLVAPKDDKVAGRIVSYLWHVLFLAKAQAGPGVDLDSLNKLACPSASECYCKLYGRCDLSGCSLGRCNHQYDVPPNFVLPEDWASIHSS